MPIAARYPLSHTTTTSRIRGRQRPQVGCQLPQRDVHGGGDEPPGVLVRLADVHDERPRRRHVLGRHLMPVVGQARQEVTHERSHVQIGLLLRRGGGRGGGRGTRRAAGAPGSPVAAATSSTAQRTDHASSSVPRRTAIAPRASRSRRTHQRAGCQAPVYPAIRMILAAPAGSVNASRAPRTGAGSRTRCAGPFLLSSPASRRRGGPPRRCP